MIVAMDDWLFDVNIDQTIKYSSDVANDYCQCGYCRNFRAAVSKAYPLLDPLLLKFGTCVTTPEELMPYEPTVYEASYCVSGSVLRQGSAPIVCGDCRLWVLSENETDYETQCPSPYFVLRTGCLELPWVLDEDMDEVISPANEPEYLQRMWTRLLSYADEVPIES